MDGLLDVETLPFQKRMEIKGGWPEWVSIAELGSAIYPHDTTLQNNTIHNIVRLCKDGKLKCYGDINGWQWRASELGCTPNPYPKTSGQSDYMSMRNRDDPLPLLRAVNEGIHRAAPADCLIHKDEFRRYLQDNNLWPPSGLLANWWVDDQDDSKPLFEQRLRVLRQWMSQNNFEEGDILPKQYTHETVYTELAKLNGDLFNSFELESFKRHFWSRQNLCKLTRGNKSTIS